ncbi:MAG: hypothetical protein CVV07_11155 [Gammaproteobacteria bacterium HGW-Gammaproteobacteria-11]|nr:MAG: hypothetical protein CVV07_11155 [Gammaproteobacteria bacterium HGW-Gammaproteobacteria-11]
MTQSLFRTCLLWLMILIIPAQAVAGALSVNCATGSAENNQPQAEHDHGQHDSHAHSVEQASESDTGSESPHSGCALCASSCHALSTLTSHSLPGLPVPAAVLGALAGYQDFTGQSPEPLKRPPRLHTL